MCRFIPALSIRKIPVHETPTKLQGISVETAALAEFSSFT
jgi:hypothetical protein